MRGRRGMEQKIDWDEEGRIGRERRMGDRGDEERGKKRGTEEKEEYSIRYNSNNKI